MLDGWLSYPERQLPGNSQIDVLPHGRLEGTQMRFGPYGLHRGPGIDPGILARRSLSAEQAGFESLWVGDHIALPADLPGADEPRLEALAALSFMAATTSTARLAAGVLVLPQRNPVNLAKQLTSLDVLSAGRLIVGVGVVTSKPSWPPLVSPCRSEGVGLMRP